MPDIDWKYIENQFDVASRDSFKRMNILLSDHRAKLVNAVANGHPTLAAITNATSAVMVNWTSAYSEWQSSRASYHSLTGTLEYLLITLRSSGGIPGERSHIDKWESRVASVIAASDPEYTYLLPQGREPFTSGSRDEIIQAVKTFSERLFARVAVLQSDAELPDPDPDILARYQAYYAIATPVSDYHTAMKTARDTQQGTEGLVDQRRAALETMRQTAAKEMYGNLGFLMNYHKANPVQVAAYYDLSVLRQTGPDEDDPAGEGGGGGSSSSSAGG